MKFDVDLLGERPRMWQVDLTSSLICSMTKFKTEANPAEEEEEDEEEEAEEEEELLLLKQQSSTFSDFIVKLLKLFNRSG